MAAFTQKHMANGEQISTEVPLSLQTFDHKRKKEQINFSDWLNHITNQKIQHMTFSRSQGDVILCYTSCIAYTKKNSNLVCVTTESGRFLSSLCIMRMMSAVKKHCLSLMSFLYFVPAMLFPQMNSALFSKQSFHCLTCISDLRVII